MRPGWLRFWPDDSRSRNPLSVTVSQSTLQPQTTVCICKIYTLTEKSLQTFYLPGGFTKVRVSWDFQGDRREPRGWRKFLSSSYKSYRMRAWEERTLLHFHIQRASPQHHAAHPKPVPRTAEPTARGRSSSINPLSKSNQEDRGSVRVLIVWLRCACEMCVSKQQR